MVMEENKQLRDDLRGSDRELQILKMGLSQNMNNLEQANKRLETTVKDKNSEIENLKREVARHKEEKQQ